MILLPPITNRTDTIVPNTTLLRSSCQLFGRKHACPLSRRRAPPTPRPASLPLRGYSPAERRPESRPPPNSFLSLPGADWPCHPAEDRGLTGRRPTPPILYSAFFRRAPPQKGRGLGSFRSEERRVGQAGVGPVISRCARDHQKTKTN